MRRARRLVLAALILLPMATFLVGCLMRLVSFPSVSLYGTTLALVTVPPIAVHLALRGDRAGRTLPRLAAWSLFPWVAYDVVRLGMHLGWGVVFWDHWYDHGGALTGEPVNTLPSLFSGMTVHALQGWVLALGFYVATPRVTLVRALAWAAALTAAYYVLFPIYVLVDYHPKPIWYLTVGLSHLAFGLALWGLPRVQHRLTPREWAGVAVVTGILLGFVPWRATTWQFPLQEEIDQAAAGRLEVVLGAVPMGPVVEETPAGSRAIYRLPLAVRGRTFEDYIHARKLLEIGPVLVEGGLWQRGRPIASCFGAATELETTSRSARYVAYMRRIAELEPTPLDVRCTGPADALDEAAPVDIAGRSG